MTATKQRALSIFAGLAIFTSLAPAAHAQTAEAEVLFREGKKLLKQGKIAQACDKLEASDRLEPTDGTELNLGDCREKNGQLATAWATFVKAAAAARHTGNATRAAEAKRRAAALEPKLSYLTITVSQEARVPGLVIKRNGTAVDPALWDQRVPVDPESFDVVAEAPGYAAWNSTVAVSHNKEAKELEVPVLDKLPEPPPEAAPATEPAHVRVAPTQDVRESDSQGTFTGKRKVAVVLAVVGVAALGGAIAYGIHAQNLENSSDQLCMTTQCADDNALAENKTARRDAQIADIGYAAGGALIATGIVLWLVGGPSHHDGVAVVPSVGGDHVGLSLSGAF